MQSFAPSSEPDAAHALLRLASRLAGSEGAEDLVQSTYVRAMEHDGSVRTRTAWLRQILVNERRMEVRGRQRRQAREASAAAPAAEQTDLEDVVHCLHVARIVGTLLDELDDDVRAVVRERYFEGETAAAIARKHAIPAGTVRWRLKMGLDRLRGQLDERYGGRRALWAGGFVPLGVSPTLSPCVASQSAASPVGTATGKGMSVMSIKILVGIGIAAAAAGGAAVMGGGAEGGGRADPASVVARAEIEITPAVELTHAAEPTHAGASEVQREKAEVIAQWERRLSAIRGAHASLGNKAPGSSPSASKPDARHEVCAPGDDCMHECTDDACLSRLAAEVLSVVRQCSELGEPRNSTVSLTASIVGAPDIGTLVESVQLGSDDERSPEHAECLTQAMYAVDLGDSPTNFQQEITVMLRVDEQGSDELDPATQAAIDDAISGTAGRVHSGSEAFHFVQMEVGEDSESKD